MRLTRPHSWQRSLRIPQQHLHPSGSVQGDSLPFKAGLGLPWNKLAGPNVPPAVGREGVKRCPTSAMPPSPPSTLHNRCGGNQRRGRLCHPSVLHTLHPDAMSCVPQSPDAASCAPHILTPELRASALAFSQQLQIRGSPSRSAWPL